MYCDAVVAQNYLRGLMDVDGAGDAAPANVVASLQAAPLRLVPVLFLFDRVFLRASWREKQTSL